MKYPDKVYLRLDKGYNDGEKETASFDELAEECLFVLLKRGAKEDVKYIREDIVKENELKNSSSISNLWEENQRLKSELEGRKASAAGEREEINAHIWAKSMEGTNLDDYQLAFLSYIKGRDDPRAASGEPQPEKVEQWISAKNRLPEKNGEYIVYSEFNDIVSSQVFKDGDFGSETLDGFERTEFGDMVTHWMPLPAAPLSAQEKTPKIN